MKLSAQTHRRRPVLLRERGLSQPIVYLSADQVLPTKIRLKLNGTCEILDCSAEVTGGPPTVGTQRR